MTLVYLTICTSNRHRARRRLDSETHTGAVPCNALSFRRSAPPISWPQASNAHGLVFSSLPVCRSAAAERVAFGSPAYERSERGDTKDTRREKHQQTDTENTTPCSGALPCMARVGKAGRTRSRSRTMRTSLRGERGSCHPHPPCPHQIRARRRPASVHESRSREPGNFGHPLLCHHRDACMMPCLHAMPFPIR